MKKATLSLIIGLAVVTIPPITATFAAGQKSSLGIKKCRDATGQWHYGDTAAAACANSKVTVINQQGVKTGVIDAPPTAADLKQREAKEKEAKRAEEQAKRDQVLLTTYAHEDDITYIRDRKVAELESVIKASQDTLKPLRATLKRLEAQADSEQKSQKSVSEQTTTEIKRTRTQIAKHEEAIAQRRQEQEDIKVQAQKDLVRYRELKGESDKKAATTKR